MIIGFDGVSRDLLVDLDDGTPPFSLGTHMLLLNAYTDEGIFFVSLATGGRLLEVLYVGIGDEPGGGAAHRKDCGRRTGSLASAVRPGKDGVNGVWNPSSLTLVREPNSSSAPGLVSF